MIKPRHWPRIEFFSSRGQVSRHLSWLSNNLSVLEDEAKLRGLGGRTPTSVLTPLHTHTHTHTHTYTHTHTHCPWPLRSVSILSPNSHISPITIPCEPREKGEGGKGGRGRGKERGVGVGGKRPRLQHQDPKVDKKKVLSFSPSSLILSPIFSWGPSLMDPPTSKPPPSLGTHCPPWAPCWFRNLSLLRSPLVITFPLPLALVTPSERPHSEPVTPSWAQRGGSCGFCPSYRSQDLLGALTP